MRTPRPPLALFFTLAGALGACPDLPESTVGDTSGDGDGEVFVALELSRVMESVGQPAGGERIAIFGQGLSGGSDVGLPEVRFGSARGEAVLLLDDGQLNVTVPPHAPGLVDVTVTLPDGQSETLSDAYLYQGPLALTAITPTVSGIDGGVAVEVTGAGFTAQTRILIGGRMLEGATRVDDETIIGTVPARLAIDAEHLPVVDVIASNGFEQRTLSGAFTYVVPLALDALSPISGPATGGTLVTLSGRGLSLGSVVFVGGVPAENVEAGTDGRTLVVRVPPGPHGTTDIVVENTTGIADAPRATVTLANAFFRVDESRLPGVLWAGHAYPPKGARAGGERVAISLRGLSAADGVSVRFGRIDATVEEVRPEEGAVIVTTPPATEPGLVQLVISRGGVSTQPLTWEYVADFAFDEVKPTFLPLEGGDLALFGKGLSRDGEVLVGGKPATMRSGGGERLVVRAGPSVPGSVDLVYRAPDGRELRLSAGVDYRSATSKLWAVSPELGAQSGGRIVRLFGEGFSALEPDPVFGSERGSERTLIDDHLVVVRAPRGDPGHVNVGRGPLGRLAMPFRYHDPGQRLGGTAGGPVPEALNVTVLDRITREGVPDAFVILWDDIDGPYQGLTDDRGQITFSDVYFGPMLMVTAAADNYTTASIVEFDARDATLNLIPLRPAEPGGGGGGPGPEPLPDSVLSGKVLVFDKYVVTPPGSCEPRVGHVEGTLCAPCASHEECEGEGALCTPLGKEGARCTTACAIDADCPDGFVCAGVEGGVQCVPDSGRRTARCQVTMPDVFSVVQVPLTPTNSEGVYSFSSDPGEYAVVCLGGVEDDLTGIFRPLIMGVRRHVFAQPGTAVANQDVVLDIPLTRDLRIRLDGAPVGRPKTELHTAQVFVNLGADGVFLMPQEGRGIDQNVFELEGFPAAFAESLYDASLTVYATAVIDRPREDQNGVGSFVMHEGIKELFSDAVFELATESGVRHRATGMSEPIWGMRGLAGTERLWAVGDDGRVAAFDGTLWGVQQTPTGSSLRGVWPAAPSEVWAAGDAGAVVRFDGLRWVMVPMPAAIARAAWRGIEGVVASDAPFGQGEAEALWVWGERGVWRNGDPQSGATSAWVEIAGPLGGSVNALAAVTAGEVWMVGDGGLIRRWHDGVLTDYDVPGADLRALAIVRPDLIWAVGDDGRILRWDGTVWFELLPVTARALHGITAPRDDSAWAVGDAGEVLRWDGLRWRVQEAVAHSDLFAVGETPSGKVFAAGVATLIVGPFMQLPRPANPNPLGNLSSLELRWLLDPGADASFNWVRLFHPSGFPFWQIVAHGPRRSIPLPDLDAAWGLQALWPGEGYLMIFRAYVPGFDMGAWDETILTPYRWRSWSMEIFSMNVPEPAD